MADKIQFKDSSETQEVTVHEAGYHREFKRSGQPFELSAEPWDEIERKMFAHHADLEIVAEEPKVDEKAAKADKPLKPEMVEEAPVEKPKGK